MDVPLGRYELESGQNFNRWLIDLSEEVGNAIEGQLGDDPQRNLELIRNNLRQALARADRQHPTATQRLTLQRLACDADMVLDLHCDFEAVAHLYTTPEGLAAGRAAGSLHRFTSQPVGHRFRWPVIR